MFKNVIISLPRKLDKLKKEISKGGKEKLYVLSDFERTLTYAFVNNERVPSLISILRSSGKYLGKDYAKKANLLYEKYHPIEINLKIPLEKRKKAMEEWWRIHFDLLIKSGLTKKHLEEVAKSPKIKFRKGALDFFDLLYQNKIPLVIISSSGLGEVISMVLKRIKKMYSNIYIVSNSFIWDKKGKAIGVKEPIIHSLNKNGAILKKFFFYDKIKNRENILLLGDNVEDCQMIKGLNYKNLIKIGFLNEEVKKNFEVYQKNFDVLILNDGDMIYVNKLLNDLIY